MKDMFCLSAYQTWGGYDIFVRGGGAAGFGDGGLRALLPCVWNSWCWWFLGLVVFCVFICSSGRVCAIWDKERLN